MHVYQCLTAFTWSTIQAWSNVEPIIARATEPLLPKAETVQSRPKRADLILPRNLPYESFLPALLCQQKPCSEKQYHAKKTVGYILLYSLALWSIVTKHNHAYSSNMEYGGLAKTWHIHGVYMIYGILIHGVYTIFLAGKYNTDYTYGHIRCAYTVLANLKNMLCLRVHLPGVWECCEHAGRHFHLRGGDTGVPHPQSATCSGDVGKERHFRYVQARVLFLKMYQFLR
jgi:hypothetical protein